MSAVTRIILSWIAVLLAAVLIEVVHHGAFGAPEALLPLFLAYVFRYEIRPCIPRNEEAYRGWLLIPAILVLLHVIIFPSPLLLWVAVAVFALWCIWDDGLIYRHHRESNPA